MRYLATLALVLAGGCASIASGPDETIQVTSEPSGANVTLACGALNITEATPARFVIARKTTDCNVTIEKLGYEKATARLEQGVNRWTWANLPVAGVGVGIVGMSGFGDDPARSRRVGTAFLLAGLGGLVVDRLTWKLRDHDPKRLHVTLRATTEGQ